MNMNSRKYSASKCARMHVRKYVSTHETCLCQCSHRRESVLLKTTRQIFRSLLLLLKAFSTEEKPFFMNTAQCLYIVKIFKFCYIRRCQTYKLQFKCMVIGQSILNQIFTILYESIQSMKQNPYYNLANLVCMFGTK